MEKLLVEGDPASADNKIIVTAQYESAQTLRHVQRVLTQFAIADDLQFELDSSCGFQRIKTTILGYDLIRISLLDMSEVQRHFPHHEANPYFLAFEAVKARHNVASWLAYLLPDLRSAMSWSSGRAFIDEFIRFAADLKAELTSASLKNQVANFVRLSNKNYLSLLSYIDAMFTKHSKLVVIRLDLGYAKQLSGFNRNGPVLNYDQVKNHRSKFFRSLGRFLKEKISKDCLVGFAWKLEFGERKSWHYHTLIILNGQEVREDVTIARLIGEHWLNTTGQMGVYHNCNASKGRYRRLGIGLIDHANADLREGLTKAAAYMVKTDYYVRMVAPGNGRTFGRGIMRGTAGKRAGRPRKTTHEPAPLTYEAYVRSLMLRNGHEGACPVKATY